MQRARRHHNAIAFLMIDLDHFKQVNDSYGHLNGDAVLHELAQILASSARESDVCARYGGEEFALILHETTESGAKILAERIRPRSPPRRSRGLKLTISIGVAATDDSTLFTQLMDRADQALYAAKQGGRNQVKVADMTAPRPNRTRRSPRSRPSKPRTPPLSSAWLAGHYCVKCGSPLVTRVIEGRELEACRTTTSCCGGTPRWRPRSSSSTRGDRARPARHRAGLWPVVPAGGFVNDDEDPKDAAIRECMEEIWRTGRGDGAAWHLSRRQDDGAFDRRDRVSRAAWCDGEGDPGGPEMLELGVFRPDELPPLAFPSHREALKMYEAAAPGPASRPSRE
jgi:diguanylate cyclase (GGDEF)-like protein